MKMWIAYTEYVHMGDYVLLCDCMWMLWMWNARVRVRDLTVRAPGE